MKVVLYTKRECGLCESVEAMLTRARRRIAFDLERVFIDNGSELLGLYGDRVPVITADGREVASAPVDEARLVAALFDAA